MDLTSLVYIDSAGFHCADFPTFLSFFQNIYTSIYGADVDIDPTTQDGQYITAQAQAAFDSAQVAQSAYNSFSPITAQGVGLSRVVKINGIAREVPSNSTVDVTIIGSSGTVITNGIAIDTLQQQWLLPSSVTIPGGGTIDVTTTAQNEGAIAAAANTVTGIFTPTNGWQTVNNSLAATLGAPVETDAQLRIRQQVSTSLPAETVLDGTTGGLLNLSGVQKVRPYENDTESTDANGLPAHSICMVVLGGDDTQILDTIALYKTPGTYTYGTGPGLITGTVYDAHGMPLIINAMRPTTATIKVQVTIASAAGWSSDYETQIAAAISSLINSQSIGQAIVLTTLFAPAYLNGVINNSIATIAGIEIAKNGGGLGTSNIDLLFNENAVTSATVGVDVTFVVT